MRISDWSSDVSSSDLVVDLTQLREHHRRRHRQRAAAHAAAHQAEAKLLRSVRKFQRGGQAAGLVELDVDEAVSSDQLRKIVRGIDRFIRADRNGTLIVLKIGRASCRERVCQYV